MFLVTYTLGSEDEQFTPTREPEPVEGVGRSSGGRALCCKGLDLPTWRIDPAWWMHLQFGLFSIPNGGPSKAMVCAMVDCA